MATPRRYLIAYTLPFVIFMAGLAAVSVARTLGITTFGGVSVDPMYWIYPIQTAVCAASLFYFWESYDLSGTTVRKLLTGVAVGLIVFGLWVSPQEILHWSERTQGFDPGVLPDFTPSMLVGRFMRLVIVVPLVEEIFWRGFLLRYLVREDFTSLPFGACNRFSFWAVVVAFTMVHSREDWPAAFLTGILFNLIAVRTKSLGACIAAHAAANLALGLYICDTRQWGFW